MKKLSSKGAPGVLAIEKTAKIQCVKQVTRRSRDQLRKASHNRHRVDHRRRRCRRHLLQLRRCSATDRAA